MKIELELKKMLDFIYACNVDSNHGNDLSNQTLMAENYLKRLKTIDKDGFDKIIRDIENKLKLIISRKQQNLLFFFLKSDYFIYLFHIIC